MKLFQKTLSLCTTCFKQIPAKIEVRPDSVVMTKTCDQHGTSEAMLERDPLFYLYVKGLKSPGIYDGYFVDVTRECNLRCTFCYYPLEQKNKPEYPFSIEQILNECRTNANNAPFILTGGEPTLHPELAKLITEIKKIGPVELLTNGVKLADQEYFDEIMPLILNNDGTANLNLSIHEDKTDKWLDVLLHCRKANIKIESVLIVVSNREEFNRALQIITENEDIVISARIKAASKIWNEQKPDNKLFVSDMLGWLEEEAKAKEIEIRYMLERGNKSVIFNVQYGKQCLMLVSWHDISNIDLIDIACGPFYRARNGEVLNFVHAAMVNEGLANNWLAGQRLAVQPYTPPKVPEENEQP